MNFNDIMKIMVDKNATDLFFIVGGAPICKVGGDMIPVSSTKLTPDMTRNIAMSFMDDQQQAEFKEKREIDIAYSVASVGRVRINIFHQRGSIGLVLRHIKSKILTLDELNMPAKLKQLTEYARGLILVTGATGSGKSTTLAAMINYINSTRPGHIVTIEDPMEFLHYHKKCIISQREIGMDTPSYKVALKSALRQTPNVLLIGEIRDAETMKAALTFADTGHLVFSTLHSINANQTMERVMNLFPIDNHPMIRQELSTNLRAIISQRLVPRKDHSGMVAAVEVLVNTPRISDLIHGGDIDGIKSAIAASTQEGLQTFDQHLYCLYTEGVIDLNDALTAADSANDLKLRIKMKNVESGVKEGPDLMTEQISLANDTENK